MSRRITRTQVRLHPENTDKIFVQEIKMILRGADNLIMRGGRTLLSKMLKGSKEKKLLQLGLDQNPAYGYLKDLTIENILGKIDWLISNNYLSLEYDGRLPLLVYTPRGWDIEVETYSEELFERFHRIVENGETQYDFSDLKDRNREIILLLLEKIGQRADKRYIPLLMSWENIDYKKIQIKIRSIIRSIEIRDV
jgi:superfamily II DNA helicase RecQ